jgi:ribosomal protein S27AE
MWQILFIFGLFVVIIIAFFVVKGHKSSYFLEFSDIPSREICPDCGGDGTLMAIGPPENRHFVRQSEYMRQMGSNGGGLIRKSIHRHSREYQSNTQQYDCIRCGTSGWVPRVPR